MGLILEQTGGEEEVVFRLEELNQQASRIIVLECLEASGITLFKATEHIGLQGYVEAIRLLLDKTTSGDIDKLTATAEKPAYGQYHKDGHKSQLYKTQGAILIGLLVIDNEKHHGYEAKTVWVTMKR